MKKSINNKIQVLSPTIKSLFASSKNNINDNQSSAIHNNINPIQNAIQDGKLMSAEWIASPNYNVRPFPNLDMPNDFINTIVIHNISLPPNEFKKVDKNGIHYVKSLFTNTLDWDAHPYFATIKGIEVSAHLFIERNGAITQFVNFDDRAWHAGRSCYLGREAVNDFSIGIEMEGSDFQKFTKAQYTALAHSIVDIYQAYPKTRRHLVGHSDIAPVRKTDPGEFFDWCHLRKMVSKLLAQ